MGKSQFFPGILSHIYVTSSSCYIIIINIFWYIYIYIYIYIHIYIFQELKKNTFFSVRSTWWPRTSFKSNVMVKCGRTLLAIRAWKKKEERRKQKDMKLNNGQNRRFSRKRHPNYQSWFFTLKKELYLPNLSW